MSKFNKALSPFKRLPNLEVDCGNGFSITVRQTATFNQEFRSKASQWLEKYRQKNKSDNKKSVSIADNFGVQSITGTNDKNTDIDYFIQVLLVDWQGLKDDNGALVKCTPENARELFSNNEGWTLLQLLVQQSTNDANFAVNEATISTPEIAKES